MDSSRCRNPSTTCLPITSGLSDASYIRSGGFDRFLVRPIDPLFHLLADRFCQDGVGNFLVGVALVIKSSIDLGIDWTPSKLLMLIVGVMSGGFIFIALNLITCVTAFWIVDSVPVTRLVFDNHLFAQYPLSIYPKGDRHPADVGHPVWIRILLPCQLRAGP